MQEQQQNKANNSPFRRESLFRPEKLFRRESILKRDSIILPPKDPLPEISPPYVMDDREFEQVTRFSYNIKKDKTRRTKEYKYSPSKGVRLQMALMYELLGHKQSINFEEMDRLEKQKELQRLLDQKKKNKQGTKAIQDMMKNIQNASAPQTDPEKVGPSTAAAGMGSTFSMASAESADMHVTRASGATQQEGKAGTKAKPENP